MVKLPMIMTKINRLIHSRLMHRLSIIIILLIGFLLRVKQFFVFKSVDETAILTWTWELFKNPFPTHGYPMMFMYINYVFAHIYKFFLVFFGAINNGAAFIFTPDGYRFTMVAGRIFTAILGTLLIYLVYKIGKDFYNTKVGIAAAVFVAFNKLLVLHSHIFKSDMLVALLMTATLYIALKYVKTPSPKTLFFASFFYGMSFAAKYNALPVVLLLVFVVILSKNNNKIKYLLRQFIIIPLGAISGFILSSPNWIVYPVINLKVFLDAYILKTSTLNKDWGKRAPTEIFEKFLGDFVKNYGLALLILFVIGLLLIIKFKKKTSITITFYIFIYVTFICFAGFYGDRMAIPSYSAIAIIAAKTLFYDIGKLRLFDKRKSLLFSLLLLSWGFIVFYSIININENIKNFNLLKTSSKYKFVTPYRLNHNLITHGKRYFSSQHRTPKIINDIRLKRNFIKKRLRSREKKVYFVQCDKEVYVDSNATIVKHPRRVNLNEFKPFFEVNKPKYQPWNCDILFLYRISPQLSNLKTPKITISPKRLFCRGVNTSYFPLKTYEKNPFWGMTKKRFFTHWIYSKTKIENIKLQIISATRMDNVKVIINGNEKNITYKNKNRIQSIVFTNLSPKANFHDFIYNVSIATKSPYDRLNFILQPETYKKDDSKGILSHNSSKQNRADIPPIFSEDTYPDWVLYYYMKTGIDLTLLKFLNTQTLFLNKSNNARSITTNFYPIKQGVYEIIIIGNSQSTDKTQVNTVPIEILVYTKNKSQKIIKIIDINKSQNIVSLSVKQELSFIKIKTPSTIKDNFIIKKISIVPDYKNNL